jgi:hypothetical protein
MYDTLDFASQPRGGRIDKMVRRYLAVQSADPERTASQRWELKVFKSFDSVVAKARVMRGFRELWQSAVIIDKGTDGSLSVPFAAFNVLAGWAAAEGWVCWGARVLIGAVCTLETEEHWCVEAGRTFSAWCEGKDLYYPKIIETRVPYELWPLDPRERGRADED